MSSIAPPALIHGRRLPNAWDAAAIVVVLAILIGIANVAQGTLAPLASVQATAIHLNPAYLPGYALRTTLRMFAALLASLIFTFTVATLAAKSRRAAIIVIPMLDILQSVPILGFLSFTVLFFLHLFPGQELGAELAAVFAIFTSQAWNMAFSFYQSLTTEPADLDEACRSFGLSPWQRFWRLDVPFAVPGLVWNTMLSMSGGWFFVVAAEAITVGNTTFTLPGIGSYVAVALRKSDLLAVFYAVIAMLVVILLYDQLLFRPLVAWSGKFRFETVQTAAGTEPWVLKLLRRTFLFRQIGGWIGDQFAVIGRMRMGRAERTFRTVGPSGPSSRFGDAIFYVLVAAGAATALWRIILFCAAHLHWSDLLTCIELAFFTLLRVIAALAISCLIWVPIGVWVGLRPKATKLVQPVAQFLAAFPANLLFPVMVAGIVAFKLAPNIWLTPLMVLGTQWYILFNVVAGASALPGDLKEAAANFGLRGILWWRRLVIPGILPYFVTGALTATGAAWNASIVAEVASWGKVTLVANGLGAYIAEATAAGATSKIVLGVAVMSAFVLSFNRLIWRPLYAYASRRTNLG
ncbi:MAG TPA: ABC transporter permease subunit [Acidiphilium sp.]|nr:MAG: sulfonate ABC transporter permease [Acidiphilium sp. 21-60-14]OYV90082.1 MAG: sulfonate ABC transporter permease [Acidiphilium sp. 37-60-79]OZB39441.1 MAG: sulfonate ABC transporter permease [Acidiphilium sp. 34-60-192]HQT88227.1 ABC transporter permease subunit [Acidiphilium sp.]HQU23433.1 ABC transporter permease subunit [Acidiphilium sp.]